MAYHGSGSLDVQVQRSQDVLLSCGQGKETLPARCKLDKANEVGKGDRQLFDSFQLLTRFTRFSSAGNKDWPLRLPQAGRA